MGWYLVLSLLNTTDVLVMPFKNKIECEKYRVEHMSEFKNDKNIKSATCEEGTPVDFQESNNEIYI